MQILNHDIETKNQKDITANVLQGKYALATKHVPDVLDVLYSNIPDNKRISFGRVYTVEVLSKHLFSSLVETKANVYEIAAALFEKVRIS